MLFIIVVLIFYTTLSTTFAESVDNHNYEVLPQNVTYFQAQSLCSDEFNGKLVMDQTLRDIEGGEYHRIINAKFLKSYIWLNSKEDEAPFNCTSFYFEHDMAGYFMTGDNCTSKSAYPFCVYMTKCNNQCYSWNAYEYKKERGKCVKKTTIKSSCSPDEVLPKPPTEDIDNWICECQFTDWSDWTPCRDPTDETKTFTSRYRIKGPNAPFSGCFSLREERPCCSGAIEPVKDPFLGLKWNYAAITVFVAGLALILIGTILWWFSASKIAIQY